MCPSCQPCPLVWLREGKQTSHEVTGAASERWFGRSPLGVMCLSSRCSACRKKLQMQFQQLVCLFDNSRLSLAVVHTLRKDSDFTIKSQLRKLLTKEDVQNKDRMAVEPITRLCSPAVLKVLSSTKSVVHTLILNKFRPIDRNKARLYPHPIFICLAPNGKFFFMDYSSLKKETKLCLADLPNPVCVSVVKSGLSDAKSML